MATRRPPEATRRESTPSGWRSRIVGHGEEAPDQLLANPRNWRIHPKAQQDALAGLLDQVGWVQDVIVNRTTGHVVDGHLRVSLAISRQETAIPVVYVELSPEEEGLVLASIDPLSAMAVTDSDALRELLGDVDAQDSALQAMLDAVPKAAKVGLTEPDAVPEERAETSVQRGDVYVLGNHRLMCGDSTDAADVARLMVGERASLLSTDPPYLVDYKGGNHPLSPSNSAATKDKRHINYHDPSATSTIEADFLRAWLPHCDERVAIYQWHADLRRQFVIAAWAQNGLHVHQALVWVKARPVLTRSHYMWQHEPCLYGWPDGHQPVLRPPANSRSVWEISQQGEQDDIHATQKPVEIFARAIEYHTRHGEVCAEPFSGSGTQIIAAERLGRCCYAMEIEPKYVQVCIDRWEAFTGEKAVKVDG